MDPICIMGPTASGKSALAVALAQRLADNNQPAQIISVDSAQVYRGMDIGTAKPSLAERGNIAHHLIDIVDPAQPYSAARFRQDALRLIEEIQSRAHVPLLVGGTMLYFRALAGGLSELPPASAEFRAKLSAEAEAAGWPALHQRLQALDPVTAQRLHPNDSQRIQRALEVAMLSGQALSQLQNAQRRPQLPMLRIALQLDDRKRLHQRIEDRLRKMLEAGFHQEVARLHARGDLHPALPSIRAVGYRQIWAYLEGETSREHAEQRALAATRQFAKRQLTWLRSETGLQTLDALAPDLLDQAWNLVSNQAS